MKNGRGLVAKILRRGVLSLGLVVLAGAACAQQPKEDVRERLNRIFYWHLSDELKLTPQQEKEMVVVIDGLQKRRRDALQDREAALTGIRKLAAEAKKTPGAGKGESEKLLKRYRDALSTLNQLDVEEYDRLKALFGAETLARYYGVREEILVRVRDALKAPEASSR